MNDERAATEVLGYVLVIGLVTVMIALVMTVGIGGLESSQEAEQFNNMERAFDVLVDNMDDILYEGVETRGTEVRLADGTLTHGDPIRVTVADADGPLDGFDDLETTPIVYERDEQEIAYVAGGILRTGVDGTTALQEPAHDLDDNASVLRLPLIAGTGEVSGDTTVLVRASVINRTVTWVNESVTLTIEDPSDARSAWWVEYFNASDQASADFVGEAVEVTIHSAGVVIHTPSVETSYH